MIGLPESKEKRVFNNVLGAMGNSARRDEARKREYLLRQLLSA
jgi:hypothetical protein